MSRAGLFRCCTDPGRWVRNDEVDFVLQKGTLVIGIEVKSGGGTGITGLAAFQRQMGPHKVYQLGPSFSWKQLLRTDPEELF